jgi:1,4-alpha-glucan branching enzyme
MADPIRVLVVLEHADESSIPLEVAAGIETAAADIDQTVCAFRPPDEQTFGVGVVSLDGGTRLDPRPYRRLDRLVREADVVHAHPIAVGAVVRVLAAAHGVPVLTTEHNTAYSPPQRLVKGTTNTLSDLVVAVSDASAADRHAWERALLRVADVRTTVVHNGIDVATVRERADRPAPVDLPDGVLVGAGGRLVAQKNLETLVEAVGLLADEHPSLQVVITGDGPRRDALEATAREHGVRDRLTFTGFLPERADVHALLAHLDLYAMPSWHEGCPVAAIEALAAGLPVVASDIPPLREVVADAGVYAPPDDETAVADAIGSLASDAQRRASLSAAARERADAFSLDDTVATYAELYRELAADG